MATRGRVSEEDQWFGGAKSLTKPVVDPKVWDDVPNEKVGHAKVLANQVENANSDHQAEIAEQDELLVLLLVQRAGREEVVDAARETVGLACTLALNLLVVVVVASDVGDEVHEPAAKLLGNHVGGSGNRGLLDELGKLVDHLADSGGVDFAGLGDKDHVALHVASGLVVLAVGDLPGEVRDEQCRVEDPANRVVEGLGGGKGLVAALVGNDPEAGAEETLHDRVESPEAGSDGRRGNVLGSNIVVGEVEGGGDADYVAGNVGKASGRGALKAAGGNGIADLLDGVVGDLELVAVGIEQDASLVLQQRLVDRAERGERGGRGRAARRVCWRDSSRVCDARGDGIGGDGTLHHGAGREGSSGCHCG